MTLERLESSSRRLTDSGRTWIPSVWVLLLFVSSFRFSGFRDPALAASGEASIENAIEVLVYAVIFVLVLKSWMATGASMRSVGVKLLMGYGLLSAVSAIWSRVPLFSLVRGFQIVALALLTALTASVWTGRPQKGKSQWNSIWAHFLIFIAGISLVSLLLSEWPGGRFAWPGLHPGTTAEYLGVGAVAGISMISEKWDLSRRLRRRLPMLVTGMLVLMILTVTRSVIAAFVCAVPVLLFSSSGGRRSLKALISGFLAFFLVAAVLLWPERIFAFVLRGGSVEQLTTLNGRLELWGFALDTLERSRWFGFGYGSGRIVLTERIPWSGTGHNLWIESAMSLGLAGALLVTLILLWLFYQAIGSRRRETNPASNLTLGLLTFVTIQSVAGVTLAQPGFLLTIGALLIAAASTRVNSSEMPAAKA